jgi:predicted Zn-dependent protease
MPAILRTHPLDEDRIAEAEGRAATAKLHQTYPDQLPYQLFKELIRNSISTNQKQSLDDYRYRCAHHNGDKACHYGYALSLIHNNQYAQALAQLKPLLAADPNNLYYAIALTTIYREQSRPAQAVTILSDLYANFPDSYAVLSEYSDALIAANQSHKAVSLLLIGNRQFKNDLSLCNRLARAEATSHHMGYAYFTLAECHLLQGDRHGAMRQLKLAKTFAPKDHLLQARIAAKIEAITQDAPDRPHKGSFF